MQFIDTHAHLQFEKFDVDRKEVIERNSRELLAIINPSSSLDSSKKAVSMVQTFDKLFAAVGIHPHHVEQWSKESLKELEKLLDNPKVVGIGEIGLDNHNYKDYPKPNIKEQIKILLPQIELAVQYRKPILFHCRDAYDELYEIIKPYQPLTGLVHCFMGDVRLAEKFVNLGLLISFAGNLTYKGNTQMQEAVRFLNTNQILLETDSPYLAPEPLRGQRNEPLNVRLTAEMISNLKNISLEEVAKFTTNNAKELFSL